MPRRVSKKSNCTYLRRDGTICGVSCFGEVCYNHSGSTHHNPCRGCGRGTASITGFCSQGICEISQQAIQKKTLRMRRAADNQQELTVEKKSESIVLPIEINAFGILDDISIDALVSDLLAI